MKIVYIENIKNIENISDIFERKYLIYIRYISMIYIGDIYRANPVQYLNETSHEV